MVNVIIIHTITVGKMPVLFLNAQSKDTVVFMSKLYCGYYFEVFCNDVMCV